jgi:hypothetical protein
MPATKTYTTPGVYIAEKSAFPPSIVQGDISLRCRPLSQGSTVTFTRSAFAAGSFEDSR